MLLGSLFTIVSTQSENNAVILELTLQDRHPVFEGHFPGRPVVPGACLLQLVKEIMQLITGHELQLLKAHQLKFITLIEPGRTGILKMTLKYQTEGTTVSATGILYNNAEVCFKFNELFQTC